MKNIKKIRLDSLLFYAIIVFLFFIPFFWFSNNKILAGGEIYTLIDPKLVLSRGLFIWNDVVTGLPNIYIVAFTYHFLTYLLSLLFSISVTQKIILGAFLSLSFLSCSNLLSFLFRKQNRLAIIIGSLFYVFCPFYLMTILWVPVYGFLFVLAPWVFKLVLEFFNSHKNNIKTLLKIFIALFIFSSTALNLAVFIILLLIIALYCIFHLIFIKPQIKDFFNKAIMLFLVIILANIFWIMPFSKTYQSIFGGAVVHQANFLEISEFEKPILSALTLNEYFWFDKKKPDGVPYYKYSSMYQLPSEVIILIIIILSFAGLIFIRDRNEKRTKIFVFFFLLFLIGVFLSKGTAPPFGWLYKECLIHIKVCGIYRASDMKFPYLVIFSLPFLLSYFLILLAEQKRFRIFNFLILSLFVVYLGWPFIFGSVVDGKSKVKIPGYWYAASNELESSKTNGRVLLLPKNFSPFDEYNWGYNGAWLTSQMTDKSSVGYTFGYGSSIQEKGFSSANKIYDYLEKGDNKAFLDSLSDFGIDTVIQRNDLITGKNIDNNPDYGKNFDFYKKENLTPILDSILENKKTIGEEDIYTVPEKYIKPKVDSSNTTFEKINPTKYIVHIKNISKDQEIKFLESYDEGWKLFYTKDSSSLWDDLLNLSNKRAVFGETHKMIYDYANSWTISPEFVKRNLPFNSYHQNSDGSIDIDLAIYFQPQSYFYLGSIITVLGFIITLLSVVLFRKKNAKK